MSEKMENAQADERTDAIDRALDEVGDQSDEFVAAAARRIFEATEW
jgi:hypothetical protein